MRIETWIFFIVAAAWVVSATLLAVFVNQQFFVYLGVFLALWIIFGLGLKWTTGRRRPPANQGR